MKKVIGFALILLGIVVAVQTYSFAYVTSSLNVAVVESTEALLAHQTHPVELTAGHVVSQTTPITLYNRFPDAARITSIDVVAHPSLEVVDFSPKELPLDEGTTINVLYDGYVAGGSYPVEHQLRARSGGAQVEIVFEVPFTVYNRLGVTSDPTDGGSVSGGGTYVHDTVADVTATPDRCYMFDQWIGDVPTEQARDNPLELHMDANKQVTALFVQERYDVSVDTTEGGSVEPERGTYDCGSSVTIEAYPDDGYEFVGWSGDLTGDDATITVQLYGHTEITATFASVAED